MDAEKRKELLRKFDRFAGGRSLTAIYECEHLNVNEQSVLLYLGHTAGFQIDGYVEFKTHRLETIARKTRISKDTARRAINSLCDRGYLRRIRRVAANGADEAPDYAMSYKIFDEYEAKWLDKQLAKAETASTVSNQGGLQPARGGIATCKGGDSNLQGGGLQSATPIILPTNSSPSCSSPSIPKNKDSAKTPKVKSVDKLPRKKKEEFGTTVLTGALMALYEPFVKRESFVYCMALMIEVGSRASIMKAIERRREKAQGLLRWTNETTAYWVAAVKTVEAEKLQAIEFDSNASNALAARH